MSFLDTLDEEGKQLYNNYITHRDKWINYIKPKAFSKINSYLDTNKRIFDQYEYLNINGGISFSYSVNKEPDKNIRAKYKKISLLFHPDKYNNASSTQFFSIINKIYADNNEILINAIDSVAHLILELDNLENIITNLTNLDNITTILKIKIKNNGDANEIFEVLNSNGNVNKCSNENCNEKSEIDNQELYSDEEFLNSTIYGFYKDNKNSVNYINEKFITEEQFIEKIKKADKYQTEFINFCAERYRDNENIMIALCEYKMKENAELVKTNEKLKEKLKQKLNIL